MTMSTSAQLKGSSTANFIFAGNATFTLSNTESGNRFTFRMRALKDRKTGEINPNLIFVSVLNGPSNTSDYMFLGTVFNKAGFKLSPKSHAGAEAQSVKVFNWFMNNINRLPEMVEVRHSGKCGKCGRKLTTPESIDSGIGPVCSGGR